MNTNEVVPVVHKKVRGPHKFWVNTNAFNAPILGHIPVKLVVHPVLK